ncbi:MAG TPA: insulinase family protein [Planctomycetaceae bacterium]|nr:insulinase family protein [Planctomycetaceae bacterium]
MRVAVFFLRVLSSSLLAVILSGTLRAAAPAVTGPRSGRWAHEGTKFAPDPHVTWGRLDNGFRYALLPHHAVPGRVALQLMVLSGSLDENDDELGIAHYIEHLAFGGSKTFKAEDMISLFQRLGVEYGSDVNAATTFDNTTFRLDFRENTPALLREGMQLFRDFGDGLTFDPPIIERERRVVLAELRNRNTMTEQEQKAAMPILFHGLRFPERSAGGSEALIAKFKRDNFLKFYHRNYRSDLMVLVGAGDFEPAAMEALIRDAFGSMERPREPIPARNDGRLDVRGLRAGIYRIDGLPSASVQVASVFPALEKADSREAHLDRYKRQLVMDAFAERLKSDIQGGPGAEAGYDEIVGYGLATASIAVPAQQWNEGVRSLDQMVRLTVERGLDPGDLEEAKKKQQRSTLTTLDQLPTLDPGILCELLTESIAAHTVFEGLEKRLTAERDALAKFTPAEAQHVFRAMWPLGTMAFTVSGGVNMELGPNKVLDEVQRGRRTGLTNVMSRTHRDTPFTLPKFGAPTEVVEQLAMPELGAKLMRFGNNVRLNFVPNRNEPGLVRIVVRVGSGLLEMPGSKPALKEFGLNTLLASGSNRFPPEQFSSLIDERLLDFSFDVSDRDAFTFRGTMPAEQIEVFLGLVADLLHAPKFNSYVHQDQRMRAAMGRMSNSVGMQDGLRALNDYLFKGDARFTSGSPRDYMSMSIVDVRRWMEVPLSRGYVEATVVGDVPEATAVQAVGKTLGALGPRAATKKTAEPPKQVEVTAPAGFDRIEFVGEQNMGLVVGTWPITQAIHVRDQAALQILAKILEIRVRGEMREKLGLAYSPSAEFSAYDGFANFGLMRTQIDCAPNDSPKVGPLIQTIGETVAKEGVTEGEFIGARGILKGQLKSFFRDNGFLTDVLMRAQERPEEFQELVELHRNMLDTITRDEVNKWAAQVLPSKNCRAVAIVPKAFVGVFDGGH